MLSKLWSSGSFWRKKFQAAAAAVLGGIMLLSPAEAAVSDDAAAMNAFRDAVGVLTEKDVRVFREDVMLLTPTSQGELDFRCKRDENKKDEARFDGNFSVWLLDGQGKNNELTIPFYAKQKQRDMDLYIRIGEQWLHYSMPSLAAFFTDVLSTPDERDLAEMMSVVKSVTMLEDNDAYQTMRVHLDGKKIAAIFEKYGKQIPADKGLAGEDNIQANVLFYLEKGFASADPWFTWTVTKKRKKVVMLSYNLSPVVRAMARAALHDPKQHWPEMTKVHLEAISSYGELHTYTTFLAPKDRNDVVIPVDVLKDAVDVDDIIPAE